MQEVFSDNGGVVHTSKSNVKRKQPCPAIFVPQEVDLS